jgi:(p)ppGpp synthase/HD superfamily hydrolase
LEKIFATKQDLISVIEKEAKLKIDSFVEGAISMAVEVHSGVKREDGVSPFLETHIWPVTIDVIRHYLATNKFLTTLQIVSAILHDIMEDNEKILDLYASKAYGFEAYFKHRFGEYVYNISSTLKVKPLSNYSGTTDEELQEERFKEYCNALVKSEYDVKVIKLADRINNMTFIANMPYHEKAQRYIREAENFYLAFSLMSPSTDDFSYKLRKAFEKLKNLKEKRDEIVVEGN